MMLFQRRLFLELMGNAAMAFVLMAGVLLLVATIQVVHAVEGLSFVVFLKAVPFFLAAGIDLLMPMSVLVAVVLTYGRWASDNEIDTLRSSGVHPAHLLTPGLMFGVLMTLILALCMDYAKPHAERGKRTFLKEVDVGLILAQKLGSGEPEYLSENILVAAESIDEQGYARNLRVQIFDDEGRVAQEIIAEHARAFVDPEDQMLVLKLYDFRTIVGDRMDGAETEIRRSLIRETAQYKLSSMTTPQLLAWLLRGPERRGVFKEVSVVTAVHMRLSSAVTCFVFVILGIPVALLFRRNDRVGAFLVAFVLALILYYPSVRVSKALSDEGVVNPALGAWAGHAFLLLAAGVVSWRLARR